MKPIHSVPMRTSARVIALGLGVIMGATAVPASADENPDWPCEQALVPEIVRRRGLGWAEH